MGFEKEDRYVRNFMRIIGGKPDNFLGIEHTSSNLKLPHKIGVAGLAVPNTLLGRRFPNLVKSKILINPSKFNLLNQRERLSVLRHEASHTLYPRHDGGFRILAKKYNFQDQSGK